MRAKKNGAKNDSKPTIRSALLGRSIRKQSVDPHLTPSVPNGGSPSPSYPSTSASASSSSSTSPPVNVPPENPPPPAGEAPAEKKQFKFRLPSSLLYLFHLIVLILLLERKAEPTSEEAPSKRFKANEPNFSKFAEVSQIEFVDPDRERPCTSRMVIFLFSSFPF